LPEEGRGQRADEEEKRAQRRKRDARDLHISHDLTPLVTVFRLVGFEEADALG
jgi:hypothetical protein